MRMQTLKLASALTAVTFLGAACATKAQTGAAAGAGGGALLGAGIGALIGGKKGAMVGAAVGGVTGMATGAVIGNYMDKQEKALQEVKGAKVERAGDKLVVKFNSAILFDSGKSKLKPASEKDLSEFAKVLAEYKDTDIVIEGHTDSKGKKKTNQKLSLARAEAVVAYLSTHGVDRSRMTPKGLADEMPVADNTTEDGRAQNRRVQIQIAANEKLQQEDAAAAQPQPQPAQGAGGAQPVSQTK